MSHQLLLYPNEILRQKTHSVRTFGSDLQPLANDMRAVMKANNGMGLAAVQVSDLRRLIIVEYPGDAEENEKSIPFTILINPKVTKASKETSTMKEGCLSVPSVEIPIARAREVTVLAQNIKGDSVKIRAKGIFARILQHEIDHLNNILIVDYAKDVKKAEQTFKTMVWGSTPFTTQFINMLMPNPSLRVTHVVTEAPKPSGRGKEVKPTIVHTYAHALGIPCLEPEDLRDERFLQYVKSQNPDVIFVAAYGKLLPKEILAIPKYGCLNLHPSLLPKYRGATPIQAAVLAGDKKTGVTLIAMSPEFDTGDILAQYEVELEGNETYGELEPLLAELAGQLVNEVLPELLSDALQPMPQTEEGATATKKITSRDRWLDPAANAEVNERKVRAFAPSPGAFVVLHGEQMKVLKAHVENKELMFDSVQPAGKKPMTWADFKRGYHKELMFDTKLE